MGEGLELYNAIDAWYLDARKKLTALLKAQPEPFKTPQDIQASLRIMRDAMECEGMLISLQNTCDELWPVDIGEIELKLRGIRDSLGRMVADSIYKGLLHHRFRPEDFGFVVSEFGTQGGFSIEVPYEMIAMSDMYVLRSKKISGLSYLATVRVAWTGLVFEATERLKQNGPYPIRHSRVRVSINMIHKKPLDPDHFWIRPILDGLVENRILANDDALSVEFIQMYQTARSDNRVRIEVMPITSAEGVEGPATS